MAWQVLLTNTQEAFRPRCRRQKWDILYLHPDVLKLCGSRITSRKYVEDQIEKLALGPAREVSLGRGIGAQVAS
jgi:hypothetical protein